MVKVLDELPVATIVMLAGIVGSIIALVNHSIDFQEFLIGLGALGGGAGALGYARAQSGKGNRK